jgi:uncharacterized RDD family membrane protein YckC
VSRKTKRNLPPASAATVVVQAPVFAPLKERIFAFMWDYLPILGWLMLVMAFGTALIELAPHTANSVFGNVITGQISGMVLVTLPVAHYFAMQESSEKHATWGKHLRGLKVLTVTGEGLTYGHAFLRTAIKLVPWELSHTFLIQSGTTQGQPPQWATMLLLLAWTLVAANIASVLASPERQSLYDRIAGTVVVRR